MIRLLTAGEPILYNLGLFLCGIIFPTKNTQQARVICISSISTVPSHHMIPLMH
jgi:hypothetical protein